MLVVRRLRWRFAALICLAAFSPMTVYGWVDDFNDGSVTNGSPVPWLLDLGGSGFFPGTYDASSGDFLMKPAVISPSNQMSAMVPISFGNTYVRAQGKVLPDPGNPSNDGGNLVVTARIDPESLTGYLMYFDVSGNVNIQVLLGGFNFLDIGENIVDVDFNAGTDVVMELNVIGDQLSGYVWAADDPAGKPALPQVTATDSNWANGFAGLAFAEDDDNTAAIYRYAAAQNTPFVDTNPSNGDFDGDGDVDGKDFLTWQRGLGLTGQPDATTGDADDDGDVDAADLASWKLHFGPGPTPVSAVPEPAAMGLLLVGGMALAAVRRRSAK